MFYLLFYFGSGLVVATLAPQYNNKLDFMFSFVFFRFPNERKKNVNE